MTQRSELLARERRKLAWLRAKVVEQEQRVSALESIKDDPLDEMFEREQEGSTCTPGTTTDDVHTHAQAPAQTFSLEVVDTVSLHADMQAQARAKVNQLLMPLASAAWRRRPRTLSPHWLKIFKYIGAEGKTYTEVKQFIDRENIEISHDAVRTALMNYRKEFGLIENPKRGVYVATARALELVAAQENESPAKVD